MGLEAVDSSARFTDVVFWPSLRSPEEDEGRDRRWDRIEALADSRHIPELTDELTRLQSQLSERASELSRRAQDLGWVDPEIDPHALPKRGRWGSPTARAYPLEIKNAFLRALLGRHSGRR